MSRAGLPGRRRRGTEGRDWCSKSGSAATHPERLLANCPSKHRGLEDHLVAGIAQITAMSGASVFLGTCSMRPSLRPVESDLMSWSCRPLDFLLSKRVRNGYDFVV